MTVHVDFKSPPHWIFRGWIENVEVLDWNYVYV